MNDSQKETLFFYLGIREMSEKTISKYRKLVTQYYKDRCVSEKQITVAKYTFCCELCQNTNVQNVIYHEHEGTRICTGKDGLGCGNVLTECELEYEQNGMVNDKLYSDVYFYRSYIDRPCTISRLSNKVERQLTKYSSSNLTTSEHYKNKQRKTVYVLLDQIKDSRMFDPEIIDRVKSIFNCYRKVMSRIHNIQVVLFVLIELCYNSS